MSLSTFWFDKSYQCFLVECIGILKWQFQMITLTDQGIPCNLSIDSEVLIEPFAGAVACKNLSHLEIALNLILALLRQLQV